MTLSTGPVSATKERLDKAEAFEIIPATGSNPAVQRVLAAPLDALWKDGRITRREFEAGEKLRADAYLAAIDPGTMSVDWERAGGGGRSRFVPSMFTTQHIADARIRYRHFEKSVRGLAATVLNLTLIKELSLEHVGRNVFNMEHSRDARGAGLGSFRVALNELADHYGI